MKNGILKMIAVVFSVMLCISCLTVHTFGYAPIETDKEVSLTLTFGTKETAFSDVNFKVYHITSEIWAQEINDGKGQHNIEMLTAYIDENRIAPVAEKATDVDGVVTFSGLQTGLYLVVGEDYTAETEIYTPTPFVVTLPQPEVMLGAWDYAVVANVKYTVTSGQLPQTGVLWWPVVFLLPGIVMLGAGIAVLRWKKRVRRNAIVDE